MRYPYHISFIFPVLEFSQEAVRKGIPNEIPEALKSNASRLSLLLGKIDGWVFERYGVRLDLTSAYRSPKLNTAVGGSATSDHMLALAADIKALGVSPLELAKFIHAKLIADGIDFNQIIHEFGSWVHVSLPQEGRKGKGECLTAVKRPNSHGQLKTIYLAGLQEAK